MNNTIEFLNNNKTSLDKLSKKIIIAAKEDLEIIYNEYLFHLNMYKKMAETICELLNVKNKDEMLKNLITYLYNGEEKNNVVDGDMLRTATKKLFIKKDYNEALYWDVWNFQENPNLYEGTPKYCLNFTDYSDLNISDILYNYYDEYTGNDKIDEYLTKQIKINLSETEIKLLITICGLHNIEESNIKNLEDYLKILKDSEDLFFTILKDLPYEIRKTINPYIENEEIKNIFNINNNNLKKLNCHLKTLDYNSYNYILFIFISNIL